MIFLNFRKYFHGSEFLNVSSYNFEAFLLILLFIFGAAKYGSLIMVGDVYYDFA